MSQERFYCTLDEGGLAEKVIDEFEEKYATIHQAWCDFATKYGTEEYYGGNRLEGLRFERDKVPLGWSSNRNLPGSVYKPARVKASLEAYKEFIALPAQVCMFELATNLKIDTVMRGFSVAGPSYEHIGDQIILSLPEGSSIPEGATKIKTSEYWILKEAAEKDDG